jgi:hypothetical protein
MQAPTNLGKRQPLASLFSLLSGDKKPKFGFLGALLFDGAYPWWPWFTKNLGNFSALAGIVIYCAPR